MTGEDSGSYSKTCYKLKDIQNQSFRGGLWFGVGFFFPFVTLLLSLKKKKKNINRLVCPKNEFQKNVAVMTVLVF